MRTTSDAARRRPVRRGAASPGAGEAAATVIKLLRRARGVLAEVISRADLRSNEAFVDQAYRMVLHRPADRSGSAHYVAMLRAGASRNEVLIRLALSEESMNRVLADSFTIQNLCELRPASYADVPNGDGGTTRVFTVREPGDFDWLERCILEYDYYEKPGIWTLGIDDDKRTMAELLSRFRPQRALEIGCSSGAVLACLGDRGVPAEGVEISAAAIRRAPAAVRPNIHRGDLLTLDLQQPYDLVFGLDIFEHFNPNRLDTYIQRVAELTEPGGFVFANVPTYGEDPVYGTIWAPHLQSWQDDLRLNRLFQQIEVDDDGYPLHGHLVWAGSRWWEERFGSAGLRREPDIERALHTRFDKVLRATPARMAFYVFSRDAPSGRVHEVIDQVGR
ncbi:MAG TPA: methyltransferase domain-containing protein [Candidatus Dormibacteraeota bacterium]